MPSRTPVTPYVALCDPQGTLTWTNHPNPAYEAGTHVWDYAAGEDVELVKDRVSRAAFLREPQEFEVRTNAGDLFHAWVWPLMKENLGVCLVGITLPKEILRLTDRERECLQQLSIGRGTAQIAEAFDVSVSTVHTYMKRAREKLSLSTMEQLIAFASRYLPPPTDLSRARLDARFEPNSQ